MFIYHNVVFIFISKSISVYTRPSQNDCFSAMSQSLVCSSRPQCLLRKLLNFLKTLVVSFQWYTCWPGICNCSHLYVLERCLIEKTWFHISHLLQSSVLFPPLKRREQMKILGTRQAKVSANLKLTSCCVMSIDCTYTTSLIYR